MSSGGLGPSAVGPHNIVNPVPPADPRLNQVLLSHPRIFHSDQLTIDVVTSDVTNASNTAVTLELRRVGHAAQVAAIPPTVIANNAARVVYTVALKDKGLAATQDFVVHGVVGGGGVGLEADSPVLEIDFEPPLFSA